MERECFTSIGSHSNGRKEDENWEREKNRILVAGTSGGVGRKSNENFENERKGVSVERTKNAG